MHRSVAAFSTQATTLTDITLVQTCHNQWIMWSSQTFVSAMGSNNRTGAGQQRGPCDLAY
jgi:hypothetical protein